MKRILSSSNNNTYMVKRFFENHPSDDFVCIAFDSTPRGNLCADRYGVEVVHRSGRYTFSKRKTTEQMQDELTSSLGKDWHGNVYDLTD